MVITFREYVFVAMRKSFSYIENFVLGCKSKNYRKEETVKEDKQLLIVHSV